MKFLRAIVIVSFFSLATQRPAYAITGDELLKQCAENSGELQHAQCQSYIVGVVDGTDTLSTSMHLLHPSSALYPKLFCSEAATPGDLMRATTAYLLNNPSTRRFNAASEVMLALQQALPCAK